MGKIKNPINFSTSFGLDIDKVNELGIVDVIINADTNLFIDPLLFDCSIHQEISIGGRQRYRQHFEKIIKLLTISKFEGDVAWRSAEHLFQFHEVSWTCLGYGTSNRGSGFGRSLIKSTLNTSKEIVDLGVKDIDLFMVLSLFEEGIGPDRISDMTTNIILLDLLGFNKGIIDTLNLVYHEYKIIGKSYPLLKNPCSSKGEPLLLVPSDIVRDLPIANDWSDISTVVRENEELRARVNNDIGGIWGGISKKEKADLRKTLLSSKESFEVMLELLHKVKKTPYDIKSDIGGEVFWGPLLVTIANDFPVDLSFYKHSLSNLYGVFEVVGKIIDQFKFLIEQRGLWRELWDDELKKHRNEKAAQRLFFAVSDSYCKSNNLDLTPEAETGNGPVDFKVSSSFKERVLVEIKLSSNPKLVHGYERQLDIHKHAEQTAFAYFLILDVGGIGNKDQKVLDIKNQRIRAGLKVSEIVIIDGHHRESASKRS
jgi:hypothetical protein